ncbi:MAG TPA: transglycosylase SLT domain-containing protein [Bacteroidia bacterium]|nr:transglycosylase SLT domain-containing protein [Bacteroidia bacterium]
MKKGVLSILIFLTMLSGSMAQQFVAQDDPIAAALDSLATKKVLDKLYAKPLSSKNKFGYAPDSIPRFDDFVYENRLAKLDAASPFDLQFNATVKPYIEMYIKRRTLMSRILGLSQLYYPMFEEIFDKYNIPLELKNLAVIESALNPVARSRAGAAGLWQFMYPTGKLYGLNVTSYIDDRADPYKATIAAAEYLQFLYKMFNDWQMVLAAYNAGPGTINRAIRRSGGKKTYWEIRPYLPIETQAYVPAFIAANYVMNYYPEHNIYPDVPRKTYFELDTVIIKEPLSFQQLAGVLDVAVEEIQYFNPIYKKQIIPAGGNVLTMPKSIIGKFVTNEEEIYAMLRKQSEEQKMLVQTQVKEIQISHTVKAGERLSTIARKYGVSVSDITTWNLVGKKGLRPGRKLVIYKAEKPIVPPKDTAKKAEPNLADKGFQADKKLVAETTTTSPETTGVKEDVYTVKQGDYFYKIAREHNISVDELLQINGLNRNSTLSAGQKLKLTK